MALSIGTRLGARDQFDDMPRVVTDRVRTARRYGKQIFLSVDVREDSGVILEVEKAVFGTVGELESRESGM